MGDVNKRLKEEINYLSRLINTHKKQEISRHSAKLFTCQFSGSRNFRRNTAFSNFPCSSGRSQSKSFNRTNFNNRLVRNQNMKMNPYKIDRTVRNNKSVLIKTQAEVSKLNNNNSSLDKKIFADIRQNKIVQCQNTLSNKRSVVFDPSSNSAIPFSTTLDTVVQQTPVSVTICENKKSLLVGQMPKKLLIGSLASKWTPNSLICTKNLGKAVQTTAKARPSGFYLPISKSAFINESQSPKLIKTLKSNLIVKTKYKVINSGKHQKFKSINRNHYFQSKQMMRRHVFQNTQCYSIPHWKFSAKNQWNASRKSALRHNCGYRYSNWKNSYYGHYQTSIFKKRMMQRKRWKMHFAASRRKLNTGSHQVTKHSVLHPRMVMIGGLLYRASKTKLSRASKSSGKRMIPNRMKLQTLLIRGVRYQMDPSRKTLKRVSSQPIKKGLPVGTLKQGLKRIDLGGSTYIQTQPGILTKTESAETRTFVSRVVNRSIYRVLAATEKKSRCKNNLYCMFYNRFGRCNKGKQCPYKHDPDKIAVCIRFLRGTCKVVDCPFSHKVAPEKMPVCSFYLQGRCNNDSCPYRHVKVSRSAEICKDFLRGYCPAGQKCKKRHMLVCQEYAQKGSCKNRTKCLMHHPPKKGQKRKHVECITSIETSAEGTLKQQRTQITSQLPSSNDSIDSSRICSPLPSYIALEKDEKKDCSSMKPASTVKGEALRIRPCFLSKGTLGVTPPVSQVSKSTK